MQIEANRIIRETQLVRYSESTSFAYEIRMLKEGIETYLLELEPDSALKIAGKIIRADGRIIDRVDDSDGVVGDELNSFCILWLRAAARCPVPENGWIPGIIKLADGDEYGCRNELLPNVHILLSMEEMYKLYLYYKNRISGTGNEIIPGVNTSCNIFSCAVNMGQVAIAMKNPVLYEESVRIHSRNLNDLQMLDILKYYLEFGHVEKVLKTIQERNWEDRFKRDALSLEEKALKVKDDFPALKKVQRKQYLENPCIDRLKEYLKDHGPDEQKKIIQEALRIAQEDSDLCRGAFVLLEYRQFDTVLEIMLKRKADLAKAFYGCLLGFLDLLQGKEQYVMEVLVYRALLSDILNRAYAKAYKYAAVYYRKLGSLDKKIDSYPDEIEDHDEFLGKLRKKHFRKWGFWSRVER